MHGQGGAWSLVCGLWAPGDPQFEDSLPVACGALSRVTVDFPSYSWERNMESESKLEVKERLKTSPYDPDLSNDSLTNLHKILKNESAMSLSNSETPVKSALLEQNCTEPLNELDEEPPECVEISELRNMNYSKNMTFMCFGQAGIHREEALAEISEVRQERGIPEVSEPDAGTQPANQLTKSLESSAVEVGNTSEINNGSIDAFVPLQADDDKAKCDDDLSSECSDSNLTEEVQAHGRLHSKIEDITAVNPKWLRHPDCKHSLEELKKMAGQIQTKKLRHRFLHSTYCKGINPDGKLKDYLSMDANKPRIELRAMSKILPKKLRTEFYCKAMKGKNPNTLMRKYMSRPANQQWLLCNKLKLSSNKLLFKLFQRPGPETSNNSGPTVRTLKEWFNIFLQEGSVDEAIGEVKKLILHGAVTEENTSRQEIGPNTIESANQSVDKDSADIVRSAHADSSHKHLQVPTGCRVLGKKSRTRRNKKFEQLNEGQLKVYNSWLEQGLSHQDALTIVLRFPGGRKPISVRKNVCAWGKCVEHPKANFSAPPKTNRNVAGGQPGVNGPQPSSLLGSVPAEFKKPIFDRIPVPSTIVDTSGPHDAPVNAGLSLEQQNNLSISVNNGGISNGPFMPPGSIPQMLFGVSPMAVPPPPLAMGSQGPRVPQRSTFVEEPCTHLNPAGMQSEQDPSLPADSLHLCIVPPDYPSERLSDDEMEAVENSIHMAISGISDELMKPIFKNSYRSDGKYEMICQDLLAKKWLHKYISCMYPVLPLKIIPAERTKIRASVVLPLCKNEDNDKILAFIARRNTGLNVGQWEVVERSDSCGNTSLSLLVDEQSAKILKNCREVGFKMGTAKIVVIEEPHDEHQLTGNRGCRQPGANQNLSASRERNQADKHASARKFSVGSLHRGKAPSPLNKRKPQICEPSKSFSFESQGYVGPSRHRRPETIQNPQVPYEPRYSSGRYSQEYRGQHGYYDPGGYVLPSSSIQDFGSRLEPQVGLGGSFESRHLEPRSMSWRGMNQPRFLDYGPSQRDQPFSNGFFLERPKLVRSTGKSRSPTPDYDELLKRAKSRLILSDEPAETSKHSKQVCSQLTAHVGSQSTKRASDRSCNRNNSPQWLPVSDGLVERHPSPLGSLCSRTEHQTRSLSSPPPPKKCRWD